MFTWLNTAATIVQVLKFDVATIQEDHYLRVVLTIHKQLCDMQLLFSILIEVKNN